MLIRMNKSKLMNSNDIWNAMVGVMSEYNFPTENKIANDVYMVYNYYSEMESGGHEGLFYWFSSYIEKVGVEKYFKELISMLNKINANQYSLVEEKYGEKLWGLYVALENNEIEEEDFYNIVEKANNEYAQLNGKLGKLLEEYFNEIHKELIEIVED